MKIAAPGFLWTRSVVKRLLKPLQRPASANPRARRNSALLAAATRARSLAARGPARAAGLAALIHRLCQPLTALRGSIELGLLGKGSAEDYRLALKDSLTQADCMVRMLGSLRELVDAEDFHDPAELIPLEKLTREICEEMQPLAHSRGLTLAFEEHGHFAVCAASSRLREGHYKIIQRALERSPERGTVRVTLAGLGPQACLRVSDQGPPARPAELEHLSCSASLGELFSEAAKRGTLEWAVAWRIFEAQGGTASIESPPSGGCRFTVLFSTVNPQAL